MNLHLFIAGTGGVGKALIEQIRQKQGFLYQSQQLKIIVHGIINSRLMRLSQHGFSIEEPMEKGSEWQEADLIGFISYIQRLQIPNAVFVDVTANVQVASTYLELLQHGVHVVACNKIACSAPISHYVRLKEMAKECGVSFLYNTNVGAALPYLQSIRQLYLVGERIDRIEAVLSGTLSYIFDRYDGTTPFFEIVRDAQRLGYTEPDPRIDLQGIDVTRKLMILCREIDIPLEEKDIVNNSFLPESALKGSIDDFYQALQSHEDCLMQRYQQAKAQGGKLKYIASYDNGNAAVGLQCVNFGHPIFNIGQKDNILLIYSKNYLSPLTIIGAGAGAQGTAMGVLSDIISIANHQKDF